MERIWKIGYFSYDEGKNGYVGAILITNQFGLPLEFRYTDPISLSPLQRLLYGEPLKKYLLVDIIGKTLWDAIQNKPDLLLVEDKIMFDMSKYTEVCPVGLLSKKADLGGDMGFSAIQFFEASGKGGFIIFAKGERPRELIRDLISEAQQHMNIAEPFDRIRKVLSKLQEGRSVYD